MALSYLWMPEVNSLILDEPQLSFNNKKKLFDANLRCRCQMMNGANTSPPTSARHCLGATYIPQANAQQHFPTPLLHFNGKLHFIKKITNASMDNNYCYKTVQQSATSPGRQNHICNWRTSLQSTWAIDLSVLELMTRPDTLLTLQCVSIGRAGHC